MSLSGKTKAPLKTVRQSFRVDTALNAEFERLVEEGGFCKSKVLRNLQELWVEQQQSAIRGM